MLQRLYLIHGVITRRLKNVRSNQSIVHEMSLGDGAAVQEECLFTKPDVNFRFAMSYRSIDLWLGLLSELGLGTLNMV